MKIIFVSFTFLISFEFVVEVTGYLSIFSRINICF